MSEIGEAKAGCATGVSERGAVALEHVAAQIVDGIIEDMAERSGLGDEWEGEIDDAIRRVIRAKWISIAKEALKREESSRLSPEMHDRFDQPILQMDLRCLHCGARGSVRVTKRSDGTVFAACHDCLRSCAHCAAQFQEPRR